ncbi:MAG: cytochrome d ubiquinol oxidase subunit II [Bryobacteraceae bacterium]
METFWFSVVAVMIAGYVVLDGYDLGAGAIHLLVARSDLERRAVLRTIGPVWDGNEVWLIVGGVVLFFAFPALYASSFAGFYLPLMVVLWLFMLRGISIEFRGKIRNDVWQPMFDVMFSGSSILLAVFFGAALGNVVRGVPLDGSGNFFLALWTDFRAGQNAGILDWYTVTIGVAALVVLAEHGALWVALRTEGVVRERAALLAGRLWWAAAVLTAVITVFSFSVQPQLSVSFAARPWGYVFPVIALAGLGGMRMMAGETQRFLASCVYLAGLLTSAAFGVYPYVLPSNGDPRLGLTVFNSAAPANGLITGLIWFIPGMILALLYVAYAHAKFSGKVRMEDEGY